jgi:hypothetical protein
MGVMNKPTQQKKIKEEITATATAIIQAGLGANPVIENIGILYDKSSKELMAIVTYKVEGDPSGSVQMLPIKAKDLQNLNQFSSKIKEIIADEISASKAAAKIDETADDKVDDSVLNEEIESADPSVREAFDVVSHIDTEVKEINGQRVNAPTGRGFVINKVRYENPFPSIMEAANFDADGNINSITLFNTQTQEYYTFRARRPEEGSIILAIYQQLLLAQSFRIEQSNDNPATEEEAAAVEDASKEASDIIKEALQSGKFVDKIETLDNNTIEKQLLELNTYVRMLNKQLDTEYAMHAQFGYDVNEANKSASIQSLKSLLSSLFKEISTRRNLLRDRNADLTLKVQSMSERITELEIEIEQLQDQTEAIQNNAASIQEVLNSGVYDINNYEDAQEIAKATRDLAQQTQLINYNNKKINNKTNEIKTLQDEIDFLMGRRTVLAETAEDAVAREIAEAENLRTGETSEDTGLDGINSPQEPIIERQNEERQALTTLQNGETVDQAGGSLNINSGEVVYPEGQTVTETNENAASAVSGGNLELDVQLTKGTFKLNSDYKVIAEVLEDGTILTSSGEFTTNSRIIVDSNGNEIGRIPDNRKALANPAVGGPNTEIIFEVREDVKWWHENKDSIDESKHWEEVPIFVKSVTTKKNNKGEDVVVEEYLGLLNAYDKSSPDGYQGNSRKQIYEIYKNGGVVTSTIAQKRFTTSNNGNIINLRTADNEIIFVNPNSVDGLGYTFVNGVSVKRTPTVAIAKGTEKLGEEGEAIQVNRYFALGNTNELTQEEVSKMGDALVSAMMNYNELTSAGTAVIVVQDPNGDYRAIPAVTRTLSEEAKTKALEALQKRDVVTFREIVGTNEVKQIGENFLYVDEVSKNWGATETEPGVRVTFYSSTAKSLVSVQFDTLLKAVEEFKRTGKADLNFSFTQVVETPEGGTDFKSATRNRDEYAKIKETLVNDFLNVLGNKRFQINLSLLQTNTQYTSRVSGKTYRTYTDYIFSEDEVSEPRSKGKGSNAILATDVANNNAGSVFFDIGIRFGGLKANGVSVKVESEMRARNFNQQTATPAQNGASQSMSFSLPDIDLDEDEETPSPAPAPTTDAAKVGGKVDFNPTRIEENKRKAYAKEVTAALGEITDIKVNIEEGGVVTSKGLKKAEPQYTFNVTFKNGEKTTIYPDGGSLTGLNSYFKDEGSDLRFFAGINYLIEQKLVPVSTDAKADITIGKVGNTNYEVKADGVYFEGKKLDNPENKTHRQLIEADIERRKQEELSKGINSFNAATTKESLQRVVKDWLDVDILSPEFSTPSVRGALSTPGGFERGKQVFLEDYAGLINDINKRINAKYNAELAALGQPTPQAPAAPSLANTGTMTVEELGRLLPPPTATEESFNEMFIEIKGVTYEKASLNINLLLKLGLSPDEANDILDNLC